MQFTSNKEKGNTGLGIAIAYYAFLASPNQNNIFHFHSNIILTTEKFYQAT